MMTYTINALLLSVGVLVTAEIIYPGPGLVRQPFIVPNSLSENCWKRNVVPYMFMEQPGFPYSQEQMDTIKTSIDKFNVETCLKWVHIEETPVHTMEYVVFNKTAEGWCRMDKLVNLTSGVQYIVLTLHIACLKYRVEHMMMHALGFLHEHQRSDRDCYLEVHPSQVEVYGYKIVPQPRWEEMYPYDKYSALHYTGNYRLRSLIVTDEKKDFRQPVGNEFGHLTKLDISKIRYKFCKGTHYCNVQPHFCNLAKSFKQQKNCTSWRFIDPNQYLPPLIDTQTNINGTK